MTATRITVGTTWTAIVDFTGKRTREMTVTRESSQELHLAYGPPAPTLASIPQWIITASFHGLTTDDVPSGGQVYARFVTTSEEIVVNYV